MALLAIGGARPVPPLPNGDAVVWSDINVVCARPGVASAWPHSAMEGSKGPLEGCPDTATSLRAGVWAIACANRNAEGAPGVSNATLSIA